MKPIRWNEEKSVWLKNNVSRGILTFEYCVLAIEGGLILDNLKNHNYPNQRMFVIEFQSYAYVVPYVETEDEIFLKTIYPSRKMTAEYIEVKHGKET